MRALTFEVDLVEQRKFIVCPFCDSHAHCRHPAKEGRSWAECNKANKNCPLRERAIVVRAKDG